MPGQKLDHVEFFNARACSSPNLSFQACSSLLVARIFIFEHARACSMLDYFILDATLVKRKPNCNIHLQPDSSGLLSTSIYDPVLIYVCHFHHHHHHHQTFLSNHGLSRYSCLHLGSLHPRILVKKLIS